MNTITTVQSARLDRVNALRASLRTLKAAGLIIKFEVNKIKAIKSAFGDKYTVKVIRTLPQRTVTGNLAFTEFLNLYLPGQVRASAVGTHHANGNTVMNVQEKMIEDTAAYIALNTDSRVLKSHKAVALLTKMVQIEVFATSQNLTNTSIRDQVRNIAKSYI